MTSEMTSSEPWLLAQETPGALERSILGLFALVPLWGFWDLVVQPWPAALRPSGLPLLFMGLVALVLGLLFLAGAILPLDREIRVDPARRRIIDRRRRRWLGDEVRSTPFEDIEEVVLRKDDTEGADRFQLVLVRRRERLPLVLLDRPPGRFAELEALADRLRATLQP